MVSRRTAFGVAAIGGVAALALLFGLPGYDTWPDPGRTISAREANAATATGQLVLIDIRTPQEWRETGVARGARTITMHQDKSRFLAEIRTLVANEPGRPIALICHSGYRSSVIRAELESKGVSGVLNVAEGMAGGRYGAGWIKTGLPLDKPIP